MGLKTGVRQFIKAQHQLLALLLFSFPISGCLEKASTTFSAPDAKTVSSASPIPVALPTSTVSPLAFNGSIEFKIFQGLVDGKCSGCHRPGVNAPDLLAKTEEFWRSDRTLRKSVLDRITRDRNAHGYMPRGSSLTSQELTAFQSYLNPLNQAATLSLTMAATTVARGASFSLTVAVLDESGNLEGDWTGPIVLTMSPRTAPQPEATLSGATLAFAVQGIATFSNLELSSDQTAKISDIILIASAELDRKTATVASPAITLSAEPARPTKLAFAPIDKTTFFDRDTLDAVQVEVQNQFGGSVQDYNGTITLSVSSPDLEVYFGSPVSASKPATAQNARQSFSSHRLRRKGIDRKPISFQLIATAGNLASASSVSLTLQALSDGSFAGFKAILQNSCNGCHNVQSPTFASWNESKWSSEANIRSKVLARVQDAANPMPPSYASNDQKSAFTANKSAFVNYLKSSDSQLPALPQISYAEPQRVLIRGMAIMLLTPVSQGGVVSSFTITPALPTGLNLNSIDGTISGTPTITQNPAVSHTVTAKNIAGTASARIQITVNDPAPVIQYASSQFALPKNTPASLTLTRRENVKTLSIGNGTQLPAGLSFDSSSGKISGTPTFASPARTHTVTATNSTGQSSSITLTLSVTESLQPPGGLSYGSSLRNFVTGNSYSLTPSSSGGAVASYKVSPQLPLGLALNTSTGIISGSPSVKTAQSTYTITASNSAGNATATLTISVTIPPPQISYSSPVIPFVVGTPITEVKPSSSLGAENYTISPTLPQGLKFNAQTGSISGTPSTESAPRSYTITATNSGGKSTDSLNLEVTSAAQRFSRIYNSRCFSCHSSSKNFPSESASISWEMAQTLSGKSSNKGDGSLKLEAVLRLNSTDPELKMPQGTSPISQEERLALSQFLGAFKTPQSYTRVRFETLPPWADSVPTQLRAKSPFTIQAAVEKCTNKSGKISCSIDLGNAQSVVFKVSNPTTKKTIIFASKKLSAGVATASQVSLTDQDVASLGAQAAKSNVKLIISAELAGAISGEESTELLVQPNVLVWGSLPPSIFYGEPFSPNIQSRICDRNRCEDSPDNFSVELGLETNQPAKSVSMIFSQSQRRSLQRGNLILTNIQLQWSSALAAVPAKVVLTAGSAESAIKVGRAAPIITHTLDSLSMMRSPASTPVENGRLQVLSRCYRQLVGRHLPIGSKLRENPISCEELINSIAIDSSTGKLKISNLLTNEELQSALEQMTLVHRGFYNYPSPLDLNAQGTDHPFNYRVKDEVEPSLMMTRALFTTEPAEQTLSWLVTNNTVPVALRTGEARGFTLTSEDNQSKLVPSDKAVQTGTLLGIKLAASNSGLVPESFKGTRYTDSSLNTRRNFGGGILGLQGYLLLNRAYSDDTNNTDGGVSLPRQLGRSVLSDFLCHTLPAGLSASDSVVVEHTNKSKMPSYRANGNCMACHTSIDNLAAGYRHINIGRTLFVDYQNTVWQPFNGLYSVNSGSSRLSYKDNTPSTNFFQAKPEGVLIYRSFQSGEIVNEEFVGPAGLGELIAKQQDYSDCMASRYYQYFTGVAVDLSNPADPYLDRIYQLVKNSKVNDQVNLRKLLIQITKLPEYQERNLRRQGIQ